jgi:hypothetical protein
VAVLLDLGSIQARLADLPLFMDRATCERRLGLTRVDVERIFRRGPVHAVDGSRKCYVRTIDALAYVQAYDRGEARANWGSTG